MGTRNLTVVVSGGEYKIAQYGQWDGYPSGQGATALAFCREHLATPEGRARFAEQLKRVRFVDDAECRALWEQWEQTPGDAPKPLFSRDHGAEILELVNGAGVDVPLTNSISFAADSLFCEWAYVIDLDARTLEVYKGFNKEPLPLDQRFGGLSGGHGGYYPVRFVASFPLSDLPTEEEFVSQLEGQHEDDEEAAA